MRQERRFVTGARILRGIVAAAFLTICSAGGTRATPATPAAESVTPNPKPVPRMQAVPQPYHQVSFECDGRELVRYHFGSELLRPFFFPLIGPAGHSLTRMGHPHDPQTHSHHNSVWISHNDVNGVSFWADSGDGRIVQQRIERLDDGPDTASLAVANRWVAKSGAVLLNERRSIEVQALPRDEWLLTIEMQLTPAAEPVTLGKTPFGMLGVRMARSIGVNDGGGKIRNSEGGTNETGVLWKRARWVDYSGWIKTGLPEGITLLDHPFNPNHPTFFHVRDDGWMGTSLTYDAACRIEPDKPLRLRYRLYVHAGMPSPEALQARWAEFAAIKPGE